MFREYLAAAMKRAQYEILSDDGTYYGEIPGFQGVYANAPQLEECRNMLEEVLEEWLLFRISRGLSVPVVDELDLKLSINEFDRLASGKEDAWTALQRFRSTYDLSDLDIDDILKDVRDRSPGREVEL